MRISFFSHKKEVSMNRNNPYYAPQSSVSEASLRKRIFFINLFSFLVAIGLCLWFLLALRVETVIVEGAREVTETDVLDAASIKTRKHLFALNEKKITKNITALSPYVKSAEISRAYPSTVTITVTEHEPLYRAEKNGVWYLLSPDLVILEITADEIFASTKAPCLLTLPVFKEGALGEALSLADQDEDARVKELLSVFAEFSVTRKLTSLDIKEPCGITAEVSEQYTVFFGDSEGIEKKLKLCQKSVRYLSENMGRVAGILYAWTPDEISFVMTGVAN